MIDLKWFSGWWFGTFAIFRGVETTNQFYSEGSISRNKSNASYSLVTTALAD
jgi:hypothetical protein